MTKHKNNQLLISAKTTFLVLTMLLGVFFIGATSASAKTVRLNTVKVPKTGHRYSKSFRVANRGSFVIRVKLRTDTLLGYGGQSKFRVQLMRGSSVLVTKYRTVSSGFETVPLSYVVPNCSGTGTYRVRIKNVSSDNPQPGIANFPSFNVPSLTPKTGNLSLFGVVQGQTINRSIPSYLEPFGTGGRMKITATWDGNCLPNVKGCRLTYRLRRNGVTKKTDVGYSHSSMLASYTQKMTVSYLVPSNQVQGNWDLRITGGTIANVNNVKTKVSFTPVCQN